MSLRLRTFSEFEICRRGKLCAFNNSIFCVFGFTFICVVACSRTCVDEIQTHSGKKRDGETTAPRHNTTTHILCLYLCQSLYLCFF